MANGQQPFVAPEYYNRTRPDFGNTLPLCVIPDSATIEEDRAAARQIAQVMLLEPEIIELDVDMDMLDAEGIWPAVLVHLAEKCVGVMGVQLVPGMRMPDWLTITRPYLEAPYVLLTNIPDIASITELPPGARVGSPVYSLIDNEFIGLISAGGTFAEIKRLPYDHPDLAARLMSEGVMDAAIVWEPHLDDAPLSGGDIYSAIASVDPLQHETREIGIVLRSTDEMLRTMLDQAIEVISQ
ncbi:hypothetical protein [Pelagibacterium xiamenense]|uniref:hypothetical protein n=1 Tax=Pelagibacterium xiamenense TaxID=2901140 RepID=UPI001E5B129C|nr:hypothetical protein [Pelagibacterium xiamenense]MCD7059589.1 hypothetical protein [Pelagibacterium xiamenense]